MCYSPHHEPLWHHLTSAGEAVEQSGEEKTNIDLGRLPKIVGFWVFSLNIALKCVVVFDQSKSEAGDVSIRMCDEEYQLIINTKHMRMKRKKKEKQTS